MPGSGARAEGSRLTASIRLSRRTALWLRESVVKGPFYTRLTQATDAVRELDAALSPKRHVRAHAKVKRAKKRDKRAETSAIYAEVEKRAGGRCECGCGSPLDSRLLGCAPQLDHFFGRRGPQSAKTCWMLKFFCHADKTNNRPSAKSWAARFIGHCDRHGFRAEANRAGARAQFNAAKLREVKHG